MLIAFRCDVGICNIFLFVDLRDPEIRGAFTQIKANHQMAVVEHAMTNVAEDGNTSDEENHGTDTFGYGNGIDANGYDTDTSQHMGAVSLINTTRRTSINFPREISPNL